MVAVMALMEAPAIIIGVILIKMYNKKDASSTKISDVISILYKWSVLLILGSLVVGF
jgi:hypothetical protein